MRKGITKKLSITWVFLLNGFVAAPALAIETMAMEVEAFSGAHTTSGTINDWDIVDPSGPTGPATVTYNLTTPGKMLVIASFSTQSQGSTTSILGGYRLHCNPCGAGGTDEISTRI